MTDDKKPRFGGLAALFPGSQLAKQIQDEHDAKMAKEGKGE